jgi:hypothetical protein
MIYEAFLFVALRHAKKSFDVFRLQNKNAHMYVRTPTKPIATRVTGCVCEKNSPKYSPTRFWAKMNAKLLPLKIGPKIWATCVIFTDLLQVNNCLSPNLVTLIVTERSTIAKNL